MMKWTGSRNAWVESPGRSGRSKAIDSTVEPVEVVVMASSEPCRLWIKEVYEVHVGVELEFACAYAARCKEPGEPCPLFV